MKKRLLAVLLALAMLLPFAAPAEGLSGAESTVRTASAETVSRAAKPKKIRITGSKFVAKGKKITLKAAVSPASASQKVTWKSSNTKIATVSKKGVVKGLKPGKVKITATSKANPKVKKSFTITVKAKAVKTVAISGGPGETPLAVGTTVALSASAKPAKAAQSFTWSSDRPEVATVSEAGLVTAVAAGDAVITAKATDGSGKQAGITIHVQTPEPEKTRYFALLIGNGLGYPEGSQLYGPPNDIKAMQNMLGGLAQNWKITAKNDLTADEMRSAIDSAYAGSTEDDVCLFYYSGHGASETGNDDYEGALMGVDAYAFNGKNLAWHLNEHAKGKVIVLLDSCGSGSMIYSKDGTAVNPAVNAERFVNAMVSAFSYYNAKARKAAKPRIGELLTDKFQVLAACEYLDYSYDTTMDGDNWGGAFTISLLKSLGCDHPAGAYGGSMPADTNGDHKLTLLETYKGICSFVDNNWPQKTQMHGNGAFVLFKR